MFKTGGVTNATLAARSGDADWLPLSSFGDLIKPVKTVEEPPPPDASQLELGAMTPLLPVTSIVIGFCMLVYFFLCFSTSIESDHGLGVNNIGLLNTRECGMIFGGCLFLGGIIARK